MAAVAKVFKIEQYGEGQDVNGDFQIVAWYHLSDPAKGSGSPTTWESGWKPRIAATIATLSADNPGSHRAALEDAIIAHAATQEPYGFTVARNRVSVQMQSGDGIVLKYQRAVPATGFSQQINNSVDWLLLDPAATLASGSITLPSQPGDGQVVGTSTTQTITALTLSVQGAHQLAPGAAITTLAQGGFAEWMFRSANNTWYRVG